MIASAEGNCSKPLAILCIYKVLFARLNYHIRLKCKLAYRFSWNVLCWPTFFP